MNAHKDKGTRFETAVVRYLRAMTGDPSIDRMALHGGEDEGDITGLTFRGRDVVVECKDTRRPDLTEHLREARREAMNHRKAGHPTVCGILVQHAPGVGTTRMGDQWVAMTLADLVGILTEANKAMEGGHDDDR